MRCEGCGLGFTDPRPTDRELEALYRQNYFSEQYDEGLRPGTAGFNRRLNGETHRVKFIKRLNRGGDVLDLGCGYGYFLYACRDAGYRVHGVDVSDWAADYACGKLNLPVKVGSVRREMFPSRIFDVITMWHFLEHVADPHETLEIVASWLKESGALVIDVPNLLSTDARRYGTAWVGWQLPYHFWHFTPETLARLLDKHGFRMVARKTYHSEWVKRFLAQTLVLRPVARLTAKIFSGTSIAVAAVRR